MAKTLTDFRAEKGLYLKDLAEAIGVPEEELMAIEQSGTVPAEVGQRIIAQYALPADYFAEPVKIQIHSAKKTPKNSTSYFFVVALVWGLITSTIASIPAYISMLATSISSMASAFGGMAVFNFLASPPFTIFNSYFPVIINIFSGIFLAKFILKNTSYTGDIKKYQFLYPILPGATIMFLSMITGLIYELSMAKLLDSSADVSSPSYMFARLLGTGGLSLVVSIILMLASAFVCAKLLDAAIMNDEAKKSKFFRTLAIIITVSAIISAVVYVIRSVTGDNFHLVQIIQNIIGYALTIALAWAVALVKTDNKKVETVVYTVLPILAIIF